MASYAELTPREREELRERWEHSDTVSAWMAVSVIDYADRLGEALRRRVEADDALEAGACDCIFCVEDRALLGSGSEGEHG